MSHLYAFRWHDKVMWPHGRFKAECERDFVDGQVYVMEPVQASSEASRRHFFAQVREIWLTLPENLSEQYPNETILRKHALIRCGFCDQQTLVCSSKAEARKILEFVRRIDPNSIIDIRDNVIVLYTAHSQKRKAMGAEAFQKSKTAVLDYISGLIDASAHAAE